MTRTALPSFFVLESLTCRKAAPPNSSTWPRASRIRRAISPRELFHKNFSVETKPDETPVTIADREIEATQREVIEAAYADHGISGEYNDAQMDVDYVWSCSIRSTARRRS